MMKLILWLKDWWMLSIPAFVLVFGVWIMVNFTNPNSRWCEYQIYQTTNGTYEVWWKGRFPYVERSFNTYEEAKDFQLKECKGMENFMMNRPHGKRVK